MPAPPPFSTCSHRQGISMLLLILVFAQCTLPRKYQIDRPFLYNNKIDIRGGAFTPEEKGFLKQRLNNQLDDSSRLRVKDRFFFFHYIMHPPAYDSNSAAVSAHNMDLVMQQQGYFSAHTTFRADTAIRGRQKRVSITYTVNTGKPTRIDTVGYRFSSSPALQQLVAPTISKSLLQKSQPVTKSAVIGELSRLVELFRNNGYYKFTSEELRVRGDSSIAALTTISSNPFDQLAILAQSRQNRDNPTVKLSVDLIKTKDSSRLHKYYINNIYIYPDFRAGDSLHTIGLTTDTVNKCIIRYHQKRFRNNFLVNLLFVKPGELYAQDRYYKTINNLSRIGVWQSVNILIIDGKSKDSTGKIDLVVQLIPGKKNGFDANLESSYSVNSNTNGISGANAGNLLGLSTNLSWLARNVGKEAIRMTNSIRGGVELNLGDARKNGLINSTEFSAGNSLIFPKAIAPFRFFSRPRLLSQQSFINTSFSYINRINLFNLQSFNLSMGYDWTNRANRKYTIKFPNIEFTRLYNASKSFLDTLERNPFLKSSFTSALVSGISFSYRSAYTGFKHPNRSRIFRFNAEESGIIVGLFKNVVGGDNNILKKYLRQFLKFDAEYIYTVNHPRAQFVTRLFGGIGIPLSRSDSTLPFFKQFAGGGSNSMRGWPVRGIGTGGKPLAPFSSNRNGLNDRTGDIQFEANIEYRHNIATLIPNTLTLKGGVFVDIGNVWNLKKSAALDRDIRQFDPQYFYQQLGVAAGYGLRFDMSYLIVRFDLGFRVKRPDVSENNGWQLPSVNYKNLLSGNTTNRQWRYENFNFTIGINYPF